VTGYIEIYIFRFIAQAKEKFNGTLYLHAAMNVKCSEVVSRLKEHVLVHNDTKPFACFIMMF